MLRTRIVSALIMAPLALGIVWLGSPFFDGLVAVAGLVMIWEWDRICRGRFGATGRVSAVAIAAAILMAPHYPIPALAVVWIATLAAAAFSRSGWLAMGTLYIGLPLVSLVWMRAEAGAGTVFWLLLVVWATDTGGYLFGRTIGGPRLAPRISPKKTWAGLIGGMLCAAIVGGALAYVLGVSDWGKLAALAAVFAVVAQIGDLFESSVKRRFDVKDSSQIIPGHGGLLDRVDGLIAVAPVVALMVLWFGIGLEAWP